MERVAVDVARKCRWTSSLRKGIGKCLGSGLMEEAFVVVVGAINFWAWEEVVVTSWSGSVSWVASLKSELERVVKFVRSDVRIW